MSTAEWKRERRAADPGYGNRERLAEPSTRRDLTSRWRGVTGPVPKGSMVVLCMSADERTEWDAMVQALRRDIRPIKLPCVDCTAKFAAEMRAEYRCNGYPGMSARPRQLPPRGRHVLDDATRIARRRKSWREYRARVRARDG